MRSETGEPIQEILLAILAFLFAVKPSAIIVRKVLDSFRDNLSTEQGNEAVTGAGTLIGVLERLLIVALTLLDQFAAIAFVVTAKSIARFKKIENDPSFAETYLVGTLLSVACAMLSTLGVKGLVGLLELIA